MICFTGIDGSGKTTLAKNVSIFLANRNLTAVYKYARFQLILTKPLVTLGNRFFLRNHEAKENYVESSNKKRKKELEELVSQIVEIDEEQ